MALRWWKRLIVAVILMIGLVAGYDWLLTVHWVGDGALGW